MHVFIVRVCNPDCVADNNTSTHIDAIMYRGEVYSTLTKAKASVRTEVKNFVDEYNNDFDAEPHEHYKLSKVLNWKEIANEWILALDQFDFLCSIHKVKVD